MKLGVHTVFPNEDKRRWNYKTQQYEGDIIPCSKIPLSKLTIRNKIRESICRGKGFCQLSHSPYTAVRFIGDIYIVSIASFHSGDMTPVDFAVGRKGEIPYMFRPYTSDPTDIDRLKTKYWQNPDIQDSYRCAFDHTAAIRLSEIGIDLSRSRTGVGTIINPKTHRKNKVYATVTHLSIVPSLLQLNGIYDSYYNEDATEDEYDYYDPEFNKVVYSGRKYIPLFDFAWYYRNGTKAPVPNPTATNIEESLNIKTNA